MSWPAGTGPGLYKQIVLDLEEMGMILLDRTMTAARRRIRITQRKESRQEDSREIGTIHQVCARSRTILSATYSSVRMMISMFSST